MAGRSRALLGLFEQHGECLDRPFALLSAQWIETRRLKSDRRRSAGGNCWRRAVPAVAAWRGARC